MSKTLEAVIREKLNTGYDPITLTVGARGINENNLEVDIEGINYSVSGNELSCLDLEPASESSNTPADNSGTDGCGVLSQEELDTTAPTPEEGSTVSPQSAGAAEEGVSGSVSLADDGEEESSEESNPGGVLEDGETSDHPREVNPDDQDSDGVDDDLQARIAAVLEEFGGAELKPVGTADNGATEFAVIAADGEELERGTLLHLEDQTEE